MWLTCEPADADQVHLLTGLANALELASASDLGTVVDAVWQRAPQQVCLVFDDAHEIPAGSAGAELLAGLLAELPGNARIVLSSRTAVPVPTARLTAAGQVARITESDLAFDPVEIAAFAAARQIDPTLLGSTGVWPALAELTATAGTELVFDYLWEEILNRLGSERVELLARLAAVGGGDDDIANVLTGRPVNVAAMLDGVPLVRRAGDWVDPHPLWRPAFRRVMEPTLLRSDQCTVARVYAGRGRFDRAVELFAEAGAWDELLDVIRVAEVQPQPAFPAAEIVRWCQLLPDRYSSSPEYLLGDAMRRVAASPAESVPAFRAARAAFASRGDVEGELVAIGHEGFVLWWAQDIAGLFQLFERIALHAEAGSPAAKTLNGICLAGIGHISGDSAAVLENLAEFERHPIPHWRAPVQWLRSVAHRRDGNLDLARLALEADLPGLYGEDPQREIAILRIDWLEGEVDHVRSVYPQLCDRYEAAGERVLARDVLLELAAKTAFFGEIEATRELLRRGAAMSVSGEPASLHDVLRTIAAAALSVSTGDEATAAVELTPLAGTTIDGPWAWYWRDRAAIALVFVLCPDTRAAWLNMPLSRTHRTGRDLGAALVAGRSGDFEPARLLTWPSVGIVRAHLPARWAAELATYAEAIGNPPPGGLLEAVGTRGQLAVDVLAKTSERVVSGAAERLLARLPNVPSGQLRIEVLGPLRVLRDGVPVVHADLRRQRVRELLCFVVAHPQSSRERIAEALWPNADDPAHNLRVTLNYVQRLLEPERESRTPPYFLRPGGQSLTLVPVPELSVDLWELRSTLAEAEIAERKSRPAGALQAYGAILPLWRGEPFADAMYAEWAQGQRMRLLEQYVGAAVRAGVLWLANGDHALAIDAAARALEADPYAEAAHNLLIRSYVQAADMVGARRSRDRYVAAMGELGLDPRDATIRLVP